MAGFTKFQRPRRWDLPFSQETAKRAGARAIDPAEIEKLLSFGPFKEMDQEAFPQHLPLQGILSNDARLRNFKTGEIIVRKGDYGNSGFLILSGMIMAVADGLSDTVLGRGERQKKSRLRSMIGLLRKAGASESRDIDRFKQTISSGGVLPDRVNLLDADPNFFSNRYATQLSQGELFGELAALGRMPRSATVVAKGDCELLEIRWQGLRDLRKFDQQFKTHIDQQYRRFGLASALAASPLLAALPNETLHQIAEAAEFESYGQFDWYGSYQELRNRDQDPLDQEPIIASQGDYANGLMIIKSGFARLSQRHGNGERTFSYLDQGTCYGLPELLHNALGETRMSLQSTLRAIGYVDIVLIPTRTFEELIVPAIPGEVVKRLLSLVQGGDKKESEFTGWSRASGIDPAMTEFLVEHRYINGTSAMVIDLNRCTRCDDCVSACADGHDNNPRFVRSGPVHGHHMIAHACMHCVDPVCMIGCPTGAIHRSQSQGQVLINEQTCIGCGICAASCPYDNIQLVAIRDRKNPKQVMIDPEQGRAILKATKCDLCVDHDGGPACQRACPNNAMRRIDLHRLDTYADWLNQ